MTLHPSSRLLALVCVLSIPAVAGPTQAVAATRTAATGGKTIAITKGHPRKKPTKKRKTPVSQVGGGGDPAPAGKGGEPGAGTSRPTGTQPGMGQTPGTQTGSHAGSDGPTKVPSGPGGTPGVVTAYNAQTGQTTLDFLGQSQTLAIDDATVTCDTLSDWQTPDPTGTDNSDTGDACMALLAPGAAVWGVGVYSDGSGATSFSEIDVIVTQNVLATITSQDQNADDGADDGDSGAATVTGGAA